MASAKNIKGITIEIEGKTSGLVKALEDANKALSRTKSALKDVNDALKQFGYKQAEIKPVLRKLENEEGSTDELIKKALAMLIK